jgi:hypothetical protein
MTPKTPRRAETFVAMKACETALKSILPRVSFGYETIYVFRSPELEAQQIGYSVSPAGKSLAGTRDGDWLSEWVVIGYEELCGDPIFIDASKSGFPVYTAMHGEGSWRPVKIAVSLEEFGHTLAAIAGVAQGREYPAALARNPLPQSEKDAALSEIQRRNPDVDLEFWDLILDSGSP